MVYVDSRVQEVNEEEESARTRMRELEGIIANDPSIVRRSRAQVEMASLQKRLGVKAARPSVRALMGHGREPTVVAMGRASREKLIDRERERAEREEEIERIEAAIAHIKGQLHEKVNPELENQLEAAEAAIKAVKIEDAYDDLDISSVNSNEEEKEGGIVTGDPAGDPGAEVADAESPKEKPTPVSNLSPLKEGNEEKISPVTGSTLSSKGSLSPMRIKEADKTVLKLPSFGQEDNCGGRGVVDERINNPDKQRSRAQGDMGPLKKQLGMQKTVRPSVRALMDPGAGGELTVVAKGKASIKEVIDRERRRVEREEEIMRIEAEIAKMKREMDEDQRRTKIESDDGDGEQSAQSSKWVLPNKAMNNLSPLNEGDEGMSPETGSTLSTNGILSPMRISEVDKTMFKLPSLGEEEEDHGGGVVDERLKLMEEQLRQWKLKAEELSAKCEELEEENKTQDAEIESLRRRTVSLPPSRPSVARGMSRHFSVRANLSHQSTSRGLSMEKQMRAEAQLEVKALEGRLAEIDGEKGELVKELEAMRAILENTSDDDKKKKVERLVYQLSCKKCNKHMSFIGTTSDIKTTMKGHIDRVVAEASKSKGRGKDGARAGGGERADRKEKWSADFARHFAGHCKPRIGRRSASERDVIRFCQGNIKVEVLRRHDGAELMWECDE